MNWLGTLFSKIVGFFHTPKAQAAEAEIAALLPAAVPWGASSDRVAEKPPPNEAV